MPIPSKMDDEFERVARDHINLLWRCLPIKGRMLEIGPHEGLPLPTTWDTLNIVPGGTFQADITLAVPIAPSTYDMVLCLEVLEHVVDPVAAIETVRMVGKEGALCLFSAPWNFRLHHPTPDLWRFSLHGWKVLLRNFDSVTIDALETPGRPLHPIHYNVTAIVNKTKNVAAQDLTFEDV